MNKDNEPETADGAVIRLQFNDAFCITTEEYDELHHGLLESGLYRYNDIKRMRAEKAAEKPGAACPHDEGFLEVFPPICAKCGQTVTNEITAHTISFEQIRSLRAEAHAADDADMAAICDLAIDGTIDMDDYTTVSARASASLRKMTRFQAYALCADAINAAQRSIVEDWAD